MLISRKTGIIVHETEAGHTHEIRSWGRKMALYKEYGENEFRVASFHEGDNEKKFKKFIRKNARFLGSLFGSDSSILSIKHHEHEIQICLDEDICKLVSAEVRSEIYLPVAYLRNGKVTGGMYAYMWRCDVSDREHCPSLMQRPVTSIVTGMCMFGANIWGIDQHGAQHPLTNTFYTMPEGACIQSVTFDSDELHPYETMMLRLFDQQIPMYKAMGQGQQKVFYQSVFEEYVLYGFQMFLMGQMNLPALCAYVDHVRARALYIRDHISRICQHHEMAFDNGKSTLAPLFGDELHPAIRGVEVVERFINLHEIDVAHLQHQSREDRLIGVGRAFWRCLDRLSTQPGHAGDVWRHIKMTMTGHQKENSSKYDLSSLLTLNFLNYAAKVAIVRRSNPEGELCLSHPFHEKAMALAYKDLHAETSGGILSVNWIPPIFTHGAFKDGLYYLEKDKRSLNELIDSGVLDLCSLEIGAEATRHATLKNDLPREVNALLLRHSNIHPV